MLLSKYEFGSYLSYCSKGDEGPKDELRKKSRTVMYMLKQDKSISNPPIVFSKYIAQRIKNELNDLPFKNFFGEDVYLVPVPGHSLRREGSLWIAENLAKALESQGLGKVFSCLERIQKVQKSAYCRGKDRPKPMDHYNTIRIKSLMKHMQAPKRIVLIDDLITRGSTMLGCVNVLKDAYPTASMMGFAVMRTISDISLFKDIKDPQVGTVEYRNANLWREP